MSIANALIVGLYPAPYSENRLAENTDGPLAASAGIETTCETFVRKSEASRTVSSV